MSTSYEPADQQSEEPRRGTEGEPHPPRGEHRATTRADALMGRDGRAEAVTREGATVGDSAASRDGAATTPENDTAVGEDVAARDGEVISEKEKYGGVKVGSAFFGWLTATGMAVLLTAVAAAAGTAVSVANNTNVSDALNQATKNPQTVGFAGSIILLVIIFIAYYCGGYVAGRMARFNGIRQGLAVWLWTVVIAIIVAILGAVAGSNFNILANLNSFPRIPVNEGTVSTAGIVALVIAAVASLVGAVLGGLAGMHFHRKVDKARLHPETRKAV